MPGQPPAPSKRHAPLAARRPAPQRRRALRTAAVASLSVLGLCTVGDFRRAGDGTQPAQGWRAQEAPHSPRTLPPLPSGLGAAWVPAPQTPPQKGPQAEGRGGPDADQGLGRRGLLQGLLVPVALAGLPAGAQTSQPAVGSGQAENDILRNLLNPNWGNDLLSQTLNSTGLDPAAFTNSSDPALALAGNSGFLLTTVGLGLLLTIVIPLVKFLVACFSFSFALQVADERLNKQNKTRRQGQGLVEKVLRKLSGEPEDELDQRNLEVRRLNDELVGLQANIIEQVDSQSAAEWHRERRRAERFNGIWESTLATLNITDAERQKASDIVRKFRDDVQSAEKDLSLVRKRWRQDLLKKGDLQFPLSTLVRRWEALNKQEGLYKQEEKLLEELEEALPKDQFDMLRKCITKKDELAWLADQRGQVAQGGATDGRRIFVLRFEGDILASRAEDLSREISAILSVPGPKPEEVILILESPGGTVVGYGLAAAELLRFQQQDPPIKLTVCIDKVAASGGYLMACCADKILCGPFAAVGSIGVIAQTPNAAKRLEREGLDFIQTTAGKWKRTVTPFKVPTQDELDKQKEDIGIVYRQFSGWVKTYRPHVDIEKVATGEVWYGVDALARDLVDELKTSAQYLLERMQDGVEVLAVRIKQPDRGAEELLPLGASRQAILQALLAQQLGDRKQGGPLESLQGLAQGLLPESLRRSGPLLRAPEEQLAPQLLAEDFADTVRDLGPQARARLLETLLASEARP